MRRRPPQDCNPINLQYLQFEIALIPILTALNRGELGLIYDWIANGLDEHVGHEVQRELHAERLQAFIDSEVPWIAANRGNTITQWATAFYYFCRRRAAFFELAVIVLPVTLHAMDELPPMDDRVLDARGMIACWAVAYDHPASDTLVRMLQAIFDAPGVSLRARVNIAILFSTLVGLRTDRSPRVWAEWALEHGRGLLRSHQPFQLMWPLVETVDDWERLRPQVFAAAEAYASDFRPLSPLARAQATDLRSGLLNPAFIALHRLGRADDFCALLQRWYDVPGGQRLSGDVLFISPNHFRGTAVLGARSQLIPRSEEGALSSLVQATNQALGLTLTIEGDADQPAIAGRLAQPDYGEGHRFEALLRETYQFDLIDNEIMRGARAMAAFPGYPHPIQALMLSMAAGIAFPITSSLQKPEPDRPIRKALLWDTEGDLYSTFEIDAVEELFGAAGIECVRIRGSNRTVEEFLAEYSNPAYDIIWIAGHGQIDYWHDGSSRLVLGNENTIGIEQLLALTPVVDGRRLLLLNICDGGASAVNGGIHRLGLAPMLAQAQQATISHFWPVSPLVAGAFGVRVAAELAQAHGYFPSFTAGLNGIRKPLEEVVREMRAQVPNQQIVQRLENSQISFTNILHWGSPCFFE